MGVEKEAPPSNPPGIEGDEEDGSDDEIIEIEFPVQIIELIESIQYFPISQPPPSHAIEVIEQLISRLMGAIGNAAAPPGVGQNSLHPEDNAGVHHEIHQEDEAEVEFQDGNPDGDIKTGDKMNYK